MNLQPDALRFIQQLVKAALTAKIDAVIIEPGRVRGMDSDQTILMVHTDNVPTFPFGSMGINRITTLHSRLDLMGSADKQGEITVITDTNKDGEIFTRQLSYKNKRVKVDYRCANPATIRAPKNMSDTTMASFILSDDAVQLLTKGQTSMSTDEVTFTGVNEVITASFQDVTGDTFTTTIAENCTSLSGETLDFTYKYPIKTLLPLLKTSKTALRITSRGLLSINVEGFDTYIVPRS